VNDVVDYPVGSLLRAKARMVVFSDMKWCESDHGKDFIVNVVPGELLILLHKSISSNQSGLLAFEVLCKSGKRGWIRFFPDRLSHIFSRLL
jgi:hypothetical protein